jgi:uncharacterized glyoxalase superfamily protein PhnB
MTKPIPDGFHTVTPHLIIRGCADALAFYEKAFGAEVVERSEGPGGLLLHARVRIGDSYLLMVDEWPHMEPAAIGSPARLGGTSVTMHLYSPDVDAAHARAVQAGATESMAPANMFWGDRFSMVTDPFGHSWSIATHVEDVSLEERIERGKKMMGGQAPG